MGCGTRLRCPGPLTGRDAPHGFNSAHTLCGNDGARLARYSNESLTQTQVVCQYFLRGACRYGDRCHNEHPQNVQPDRRPAFGGGSSVAFAFSTFFNQTIGSTWTPASVQRTIPYRHAKTLSLLLGWLTAGLTASRP